MQIVFEVGRTTLNQAQSTKPPLLKVFLLTRYKGLYFKEVCVILLLIELREAAEQFKETREFQERFRTWVRAHLRRPAFLKRLQDRKFTLPEV